MVLAGLPTKKNATDFSPPLCHGQVPQRNVRPTLDTWPPSLTGRLKTSLLVLQRTFLPVSIGLAFGLEDIGGKMIVSGMVKNGNGSVMKNGSGRMVHLGTIQTGP